MNNAIAWKSTDFWPVTRFFASIWKQCPTINAYTYVSDLRTQGVSAALSVHGLIVVNTHAHVIVSVTRNFPRVIRTRQRYFFTRERCNVTRVTRRTKLRSTQERSLLDPCLPALLFSSPSFRSLQGKIKKLSTCPLTRSRPTRGHFR